jgi:hypothetical protein
MENLEDFASQLNRLLEIEKRQRALLLKLYYHHKSQAKPASTPVSRRYHQELAGEIAILTRGE